MDLARIKVKMEGEDKALLMLTSFPESYKSLVITLTYKTSITINKVQTTLLSYYQRVNKNVEESAYAGASEGQGLTVKNILSGNMSS
jgi:hypothetical protein